MNAEIIQFPKAEERQLCIWTCICDSQDFELYSDGSVVCAQCALTSREIICGLKYDV